MSTIARLIILLLGLFFFVSYIDLPQSPYFPRKPDYFPVLPRELEQNLTETGIQLGKELFFDSLLSRDFSLSCASCHKPEYAFSDSGMAKSVGFNGKIQKRNTPPLFNLAWSTRYFWDGRVATLEEQALEVITSHNELNGSWPDIIRRVKANQEYVQLFHEAFPGEAIDSVLISKALAQFQLTLISKDSKYDRVLRGEDQFTEEEYKGFVFVNDQSMGNCLHCHVTDAHGLGTNAGFANNGLDADFTRDEGLFISSKDSADLGRFKVPSFRNLLYTAPYMHDGRFASLEEVIDFYGTRVHEGPHLDPQMNYFSKNKPLFSKEEKGWILAFLKTMTDSAFVDRQRVKIP